jgi:hypothetical protein
VLAEANQVADFLMKGQRGVALHTACNNARLSVDDRAQSVAADLTSTLVRFRYLLLIVLAPFRLTAVRCCGFSCNLWRFVQNFLVFSMI